MSRRPSPATGRHGTDLARREARSEGGPRKFGTRVLMLCAEAERALAAAVAAHGRWVTGKEIDEEWDRVQTVTVETGEENPPTVRRPRWTRALIPALESGRVATTKVGTIIFFVPDAGRRLPLPMQTTDTGRVLCALARAVDRWNGAVRVSAVEDEIAKDASLALQLPRPVCAVLSSLLYERQVKHIRVGHGTSDRNNRVYFTTLTGPRRIARGAEWGDDQRIGAIRAAWRLAGGRPLTTRAILNFAARSRRYHRSDSTSSRWARLFLRLAEEGFLLRIPIADDGSLSHQRWAIASEWNALTDAERAARLHDPVRVDLTVPALAAPALPEPISVSIPRPPELAADGVPSVPAQAPARHAGSRPATGIDVTHVSLARDMRALVRHAIEYRARGATDPDHARVLRTRPLTVVEVEVALESHGHLARTGRSLSAQLNDAAQQPRTHAVNAVRSVQRIGIVRNVTFYAPEATPEAVAYVRYAAARAAMNESRLREVSSELISATSLSASNVIAIHEGILSARHALLRAEIADRVQALRSSAAMTELLPEERAADDALEAALAGFLSDVHVVHDTTRVRPSETAASADACTPPVRWRHARRGLVDSAEAGRQLAGLMPAPKGGGYSMLSNLRSIRVIRDGEDTEPDARGPTPGEPSDAGEVVGAEKRERRAAGRRIERKFDRVSFGAYAAARFGGATAAAYAAQATHVLGELRDSTVVAAALRLDQPPGTNAGTAAGLGMLDDDTARRALARFVMDALDTERPVHSDAVIAACYGLGPRPAGGLASALGGDERTALERASGASNAVVKQTALRALRAWDERWSRDKLLQR
jgi:hypothetical protein